MLNFLRTPPSKNGYFYKCMNVSNQILVLESEGQESISFEMPPPEGAHRMTPVYTTLPPPEFSPSQTQTQAHVCLDAKKHQTNPKANSKGVARKSVKLFH